MNVKQLTMSFTGTVIRIAILIIAILVIYKAGGKAYDFGYRIFTEAPMESEPGRDVNVTVTQGDSQNDISEMLEEKGLIRDALLFSIQKKLSSYKGDIKPGLYTLNTSMTTDQMLEVMVGKTDTSDDDDEIIYEESEADPLTEINDPMDEGTEVSGVSAEIDAPSDAGEGAEDDAGEDDSVNIEIGGE